MSFSSRKASLVVVAASIAAVEALKDQGFARWNYPIRLVNQHLQTRVSSYVARTKKMENVTPAYDRKEGITRNLVEKHRKVMELGCWGPESIRF